MRRSIIVMGLLLSSACLIHGQKYRMGQAPPKAADPAVFKIHVHISASHIRLYCSGSDVPPGPNLGCGYGLYVDAVLDGKKVELWGATKIGKQDWSVLAPGDYTAQLTKDDHNADQTAISRNYTFLLPDGTLWPCQLSGITE